ncbi:unnamed protein product [Prorocentrum cordatum]|uniref:Uncharacterized protein n=1 Tax=Prorocentrum cordatum TaxID=2364126 RepID=A0ABN9QHZ0_9DINO|nr:unnamed protein product [Polarella glacialis]
MLASMSTALTMALSSNDILAFASAEKNTKDRAGTQRARLGSMCSGSGVGGLALHKCAECQSRSEGNLVEFECSSPCEIDRHKADWLKHLDLAPLVFEDITQMGLEQRCDWTSESSPPIPDVQVVLLWFSCKDLSIYNIPVAQLMSKLGHAFFASDTMAPTMLGAANMKPRVYFGGRRRSSLGPSGGDYAADVLASITFDVQFHGRAAHAAELFFAGCRKLLFQGFRGGAAN